MKKLFLVLICTVLFATTKTNAQVTINFGTPPVWAPADRVETQYYYLPDIDTYYDVPQKQYIYLSNSKWIRSRSLPSRYVNYNLRGTKVIYLTDYRGNSPYVFHKNHKIKYFHTVKKERVVIVNADGKHKAKGHGKKKHGKKD